MKNVRLFLELYKPILANLSNVSYALLPHNPSYIYIYLHIYNYIYFSEQDLVFDN